MGGAPGTSPRVSHSESPARSPQAIKTYLEQTSNSYSCPALQHIWKVNREGEVRDIQLLYHHPVP